MGAICGSLGGVERDAGTETARVIERLERRIIEIESATAKIISQTVNQTTVVNNTVVQPAPRYSQTFSGVTSVTIPASTHGFSTKFPLVMCYDGDGKWFLPDAIEIDPGTFTITVSIFLAHTFTVVVT